jgi:glutathione S-transferase
MDLKLNFRAGEQQKPEYLKLNPNAVVPTLVDSGRVIIESTVINEYLDDAHPEPRLRPADPGQRARMRLQDLRLQFLWNKRPHIPAWSERVDKRPG